MKSLAVLVFAALVGIVLSGTAKHPRGCIYEYVMGRCIRECEEGTRAYSPGCRYLTPEATCDEPNPKEDTRGKLCDYSACYCEPPTVRDTVTKKCVPLDQCSKKE